MYKQGMKETIYFGGGCFWCTEAVFDRVRGVLDVQSGYANGHVYRSAIYTTTEAQLQQAQAFVQQLNAQNTFGQPVVTQVQPLDNYWPAEGYHQDYFARNPLQGYCAYVVGPKVQKFLHTFAQHVKQDD